MMSGGSSSCAASSAVATTSATSTAIELAHVFDVRTIDWVVAHVRLEPTVEDFVQHRFGCRAQAQREHICVIPGPGATRGLGVGAEGGAYARNLVGCDRGARAGPAA